MAVSEYDPEDRSRRLVNLKKRIRPTFFRNMDYGSINAGDQFSAYADKSPGKVETTSINGGKEVMYQVNGEVLLEKTSIEATASGKSVYITKQTILNADLSEDHARHKAVADQIAIEQNAGW